jgi:hypothetical protein
LLYFEFSDKFEDRMESHPAWEMIYIDRGRCTVVADNKSFLLEQGEMYFHKPHEAHMLQIPEGEFPNILVCSFLCDSPALLHLKEQKLRASATVKGHIAAIIHETRLNVSKILNLLQQQGLVSLQRNTLLIKNIKDLY